MLFECYIVRQRHAGRWSGKGLGKHRTQEILNPSAVSQGPKPGMHAPSPKPAGSFKGSTSPLVAGRLSFSRSTARSLLAHSKAEKIQCASGERATGSNGLTFPRATKAAASSTWVGSDSAYGGLLNYASQNSWREQGHSLGLLQRKLSNYSVPGLHFPEFPGHLLAFPGRKCRLLLRESGVYFPACRSGTNSITPPFWNRKAPKLRRVLLYPCVICSN